MSYKNTLEESIMKAFWETTRPLNTLEVWEFLASKNIQIPVMYLNKVIRAMLDLQLLEEKGERSGYKIYRPKVSVLRFYQSPIKITSFCRKEKEELKLALIKTEKCSKKNGFALHFKSLFHKIWHRLN